MPDDIQTMRIAAQQREWNTLQDTFKRLIANLDPLIALQIPSARLQAFLPVFHQYYPEAGWVRELMLTVVSYASAPNELPMNALGQFPSPGCGNFLMGVFDIARSVQQGFTVFERYSHITNAVANATLADLQHTYFSQHEAAYRQLRDPETDDATRAQVQYAFWLDETIAQRDRAIWNAIIDQTQELLEANS